MACHGAGKNEISYFEILAYTMVTEWALMLYGHHKHNDDSNKCPCMILRVRKDYKLEDMTKDQILLLHHKVSMQHTLINIIKGL